MPDTLHDLTRAIRRFADERDWEQFHSPKNLAMAMIVEAGELVEHFQWLTQEQSKTPPDKNGVEQEMADILIYLLRLADRLNVDLLEAANNKLLVNEKKYPVAKAKGRADKYNRLGTSS